MYSEDEPIYPLYDRGKLIGYQSKDGTCKWALGHEPGYRPKVEPEKKVAPAVDVEKIVNDVIDVVEKREANKPINEQPLVDQTIYFIDKLNTPEEKQALGEVSPEAVDLAIGVLRRKYLEKVNTGRHADFEKQFLKEFQEYGREIHEPVKPQNLRRGISDLPGMEGLKPLQSIKYREPFEIMGYFSPKERERLQGLYQEWKEAEKSDHKKAEKLHKQIVDDHPLYQIYQALHDQALQNIAFWNDWLNVADSVLDYHLENLKDPNVDLPPYVKYNLLKRTEEGEKIKERILGKQKKPPKPGMFSAEIEPEKPKKKGEEFRPNLPEWDFEDANGHVYMSREALQESIKDEHRLDWIKDLKGD